MGLEQQELFLNRKGSKMDSVFRDLFQNKKYAVELNKALLGYHVSENDVITDNVHLFEDNDYRNAVAFTIKENHVMVLAEHDSIISTPYLTFVHYDLAISRDIYKDIWDDKKSKIENSKYYVLYFGDEDLDPEKEIATGKEGSDLYFGVTIYNINKIDKIHTLRDCAPLIEYRKFADIFKYYRNIRQAPESAADATIKKCLEQGILEKYLTNNENKVRAILEDDYEINNKI